jgi:hypothetical protein
VLAVEYPIMGGKADAKTRAKMMSQPPGSARQLVDTPASQPKNRCE